MVTVTDLLGAASVAGSEVLLLERPSDLSRTRTGPESLSRTGPVSLESLELESSDLAFHDESCQTLRLPHHTCSFFSLARLAQLCSSSLVTVANPYQNPDENVAWSAK